VEVVCLSVILANLDNKKASVRWDYHLSGVAERGVLYASRVVICNDSVNYGNYKVGN
jgi:hypothetical protein